MLLCLVLALLLNHKATADLWLAEELREQPATSASAVLVRPALAWTSFPGTYSTLGPLLVILFLSEVKWPHLG